MNRNEFRGEMWDFYVKSHVISPEQAFWTDTGINLLIGLVLIVGCPILLLCEGIKRLALKINPPVPKTKKQLLASFEERYQKEIRAAISERLDEDGRGLQHGETIDAWLLRTKDGMTPYAAVDPENFEPLYGCSDEDLAYYDWCRAKAEKTKTKRASKRKSEQKTKRPQSKTKPAAT